MTKILFINAKNVYSEVETRYPGLGLAYLAASLRKSFGANYFDIKIIERGNEDEVKKQILDFSPDIIGISSVTQNFNLAKRFSDFASSNKIPVIMGGVHVSMLPETIPQNVELACIGEAEATIVEVFKIFEDKKSFPKEDLRAIKGIAYWYNGEMVMTENRPMIEDLDSITMPARDLLKIEKHSYVFSSRGCPYRCTFCASSRFWDKVRLFSAEYVVREIKELHERYGVDFISFFDDLFIINIDRLKEITAILKREGLHGKIKFSCSCRSNLINEEVAVVLKEMGIISVGMGLESGSKRILEYLKGKSTSIEHNKKAVEILKKHGLAVNASFVIGSPDETEEEMMETYRFIRDNGLDLVDIYVLMPLPGTPVWEYAKQRKIISNEMDWGRLNVNFEVNRNPVVVSEKYSFAELMRIYRRFRRLRFYMNVKNVWHSPFIADLPKYALRMAREKVLFIFKK